ADAVADEIAQHVRVEVAAQLERTVALALVLRRERRRARQHRRAVVARTRRMARRAIALEELASRMINLHGQRLRVGDIRHAGGRCVLGEARAERGGAERCDARRNTGPRHLRNLFGQMPPRPGAMMPSGSIASLSCSRKRRNAWLLKLYVAATSSW